MNFRYVGCILRGALKQLVINQYTRNQTQLHIRRLRSRQAIQPNPFLESATPGFWPGDWSHWYPMWNLRHYSLAIQRLLEG